MDDILAKVSFKSKFFEHIYWNHKDNCNTLSGMSKDSSSSVFIINSLGPWLSKNGMITLSL